MNVSCLLLSQYLNIVFWMSTNCNNTQSNFVAKWYNCLIPHHQQKSSRLCNVVTVFQHCTMHPIHDNPLAYLPGAFSVIFMSVKVLVLLLVYFEKCILVQIVVIFTARGYAKRGICRRRVSVCVSVCLSHSGIVLKRLNVGSRKQRRTIAPWF